MNEITTIDNEPKTRTQVPALVASGGRVQGIIPRDIDQVWRIAQMIHKADMAPKDFKSPEKVAVAILHGAEIGLPPMMALQRIAVINGRPSVWGEAVPGLALATGLVEDWVERIDGEGTEQMVATCRVKRKGIRTPAEKTFSVGDARKAGLWGKAGPWTQYSKRMLTMRARVAFRDLFADALGGLYIAEELIGVDEPKDITPHPAEPIRHIEQSAASEPAPSKSKPLPPMVGQQEQQPLNPEEVLASIKAILDAVTNADNLSDVWETSCLPKLDGAFPPDLKTAQGYYRAAEKRLEP